MQSSPYLLFNRIAVPAIALLAFAACWIIYTDVHQSLAKGANNPNDFVTLYAGAICTSTDCNPYSVPDLDAVLRDRRGTAVLQDWADQLPIYPPTTLFVLKAFGSLSYRKATLTWYWLSLAVYIAGCCWAFLFSPVVRREPLALRAIAFLFALHFPKMIQCLGFGNPSILVTGLLLFAVFDDMRARYIPRVICAACAVWLKVTVGFPLMILAIFSDGLRSRRAWMAAAAFTAVTAGVLLYESHPPGMHDWVRDLWQDIALGEQTGMSASVRISPSNVLLNAANIPGYFTRNALVIDSFVLFVVGLLTAALVIGSLRFRRPWGQSAYEATIPAVAILSLLPVYHRFCDVGLVLFVAPWWMRRVAQRRDITAGLVAPIFVLLYFSWARWVHVERFSEKPLGAVTFFYYRGDPLLVLILAVLVVTSVWVDGCTERARLASG